MIVHVRTQKGKGYQPGRDRPGLVPRGRAAADHRRRRRPTRTTGSASGARSTATAMASAAAGGLAGHVRPRGRGRAPRRRHRSWPTAARTAHDSRGRRPAAGRRRPPTRRKDAQLHGVLRRGAGRARRDGPADRRRSPPGMPTGTGLAKFQAAYPERFIDVGIAEQHAVTLATGLALGGMRPGRRAVLDVPPARVRPDRPRRLPERRAGAARRRPRGPRRRGRHQPPGHVHRSRRSGCCRTS